MATSGHTLQTDVAANITVDAKTAFKNGSLPYFAPELVGLFVRVKLGPSTYLWSRVVEAANDLHSVYTWQPRPGLSKNFALRFKVEGLSSDVTLESVSGSPPLATEVKDYFDANPTVSFSEEEIREMVSRIKVKVVARPLSDDDARELLKFNEALKNSKPFAVNYNSLAEREALKLATAAHSSEAEPAGALVSVRMSQGGLTQSQSESFILTDLQRNSTGDGFGLGADMTQSIIFDDGDKQRLLQNFEERNDALAHMSRQRTQDQEKLVELTQRNKDTNRTWVLLGERFEKEKGSTKEAAKEESSYWELKDDARYSLVHAYVERTEAKDQKKDGQKAKAGGGADKKRAVVDETDRLVKHCLATKESQKLTRQLSDQILEVSQSPIPAVPATPGGSVAGTIKADPRPLRKRSRSDLLDSPSASLGQL